MVANAERVLQILEIPYRVVRLCRRHGVLGGGHL